jgi:hypothetical protein
MVADADRDFAGYRLSSTVPGIQNAAGRHIEQIESA